MKFSLLQIMTYSVMKVPFSVTMKELATSFTKRMKMMILNISTPLKRQSTKLHYLEESFQLEVELIKDMDSAELTLKENWK